MSGDDGSMFFTIQAGLAVREFDFKKLQATLINELFDSDTIPARLIKFHFTSLTTRTTLLVRHSKGYPIYRE